MADVDKRRTDDASGGFADDKKTGDQQAVEKVSKPAGVLSHVIGGVQLSQLLTVLVSSLVVALTIIICVPTPEDALEQGDISGNAPVTALPDEEGDFGNGSSDADEGGSGGSYEYAEDILGVYEVRVVARDEAVRTKNLQAAARALNGVIIEPGMTLSLNEVVGEPVAERGYEEVAGVESAAEAIDQMATALHVAALKAGLSVSMRNAHVVAADYMPLGLDAMVVWGMEDLKVSNETDHAMSVQATASGTTITVSIFGVSEDPSLTRDVRATVVNSYTLPASEVFDDPLAQGFLSTDSVRFSETETYLDTYRNGELESSELLYADVYQMPGDSVAAEGEGA